MKRLGGEMEVVIFSFDSDFSRLIAGGVLRAIVLK